MSRLHLVLGLALALVLAGASCRDAAPPPGASPSPGSSDPSGSTARADSAGSPGLGDGTAGPGSPRSAACSACPRCPAAPPCEADEPDDPAGAPLALTRTGFAELPGWVDERHADALPAVLASCARLAALADDARVGADPHSGVARDWRALCAGAAAVGPGDHVAARALFERELVPWAARGPDGAAGKITGYCVHALRASRTRHGPYQAPILARPPDLVSVTLGDFIDDGRGRRIWGRVRDGALIAYPSRAEIRRGALGAAERALLWADDPVDVVFAEIEGSARAVLDDGTTAWLGFAGKNGHRFRGVGGILKAMGELAPGQGSMAGIRAWFAANPGRFDEVVEQNPAKVFFELSAEDGAVGTQGVALTPLRSVAIDRGLIALSTPIWLDTEVPAAGGGRAPLRRVVVAQDTGGAILGPLRADLYFGDDADAIERAGHMTAPGRMWLLLPRGLGPAR